MVIAVLAVVSIVVAPGVRAFLLPVPGAPFPDGPVMVLGGDAERAAHAAALVGEAGPTRPVWVVHESIEAWEAVGRGCDEPYVHCIRPEPVSTWGEAQEAVRLAERHGWDRLTVVTSAYHRTRVRLLMGRCLDVPVRVTGPDRWPVRRTVPLRLAAREVAATLVSAVIHHDC